MARLEALAKTVRVAEFGVFVADVTVNQLALDVAVKVAGVVLLKFTVWETGVAAPTVWERMTEEGVAVTVVVVLFWTVKVTGKVMVVVPPVTAMEPEYTPATNPAALTDTFTVPLVVPLTGVTVNQPLGVEVAVAVNAVCVPLETVSACAAGAGPPTSCVNGCNPVGLVVNPLPPPVPAVRFMVAVSVLLTPESPPKPTKASVPPKVVGFWNPAGEAVKVSWAGV